MQRVYRVSHQTGWTGVIGALIQTFGRVDGPHVLEIGKATALAKEQPKGN